jgi:hypothetical protein
MSVLEELQVFAHDKRVEQLFMDDVEVADGSIFPGIMHGELQHRSLSRGWNAWDRAQIQMKLDRVRDA